MHPLPEHSSAHRPPAPDVTVMLLIIIIYFSLLQLSCLFLPPSKKYGVGWAIAVLSHPPSPEDRASSMDSNDRDPPHLDRGPE